MAVAKASAKGGPRFSYTAKIQVQRTNLLWARLTRPAGTSKGPVMSLNQIGGKKADPA